MLRIVACIKQVPDTSQVRMDPETNTLIREGVPSIINPFDIHAIEEAVRLKETYGGTATMLCMGPPWAKESLQKALSFGADDAVLLTDRALAGSDTWATSVALAAAIRKLDEEAPVDIVICGKQTIDGDTAQVGPGIATRLGYTQLTYVDKVELVNL
ncbi:MAG: electron transfer flavoprotein subunit beta/FixA family protein, partial [Armatimonadota bacterium]